MRMLWNRSAFVAGVLLFVASTSRAEEPWETVVEKPYVVKVQPRPGTQARAVWAEGELAASASDVQAVLTDVDLPVVSSRDFVCHVVQESKLAEDGTGAFAQRWWAQPDAIPGRRDTVRLRLNEGSWRVEPRGEGKAYVIYKFTVDPAGSIPGFLIRMGQKTGVVDTLRAVEKRARWHAEEQRKKK
jgi:hypothetical protein